MKPSDENPHLLDHLLTEMNDDIISWDDLPKPSNDVRERLYDRVFAPAKARSFLSKLTHANENALVVADASGIVEWVSPAFTRMCGYTLEELHGQQPGKMLQGEETTSESVAILREGIRNRRPAATELVNYHKNGDRYEVKIELNPLFSPTGECEGFIAVEHKIS